MNADQMVTATFGPPTGTAITAATINRKKRTASFSFTAPGAITGFECELIKPKVKVKVKHHKKHHGKAKAGKAKKKAPKPSFSACVAGQTYKHLLPGSYSFAVRALDSLGADAVPATQKFHLPKPKLKHHHRKHKPAKH
ncbi:MAG: hypothetical protein H0X42_09655 [Solirubrobacterales bacterium]|nr:hypothetical protein [Solirubrobacterales bacterium]